MQPPVFGIRGRARKVFRNVASSDSVCAEERALLTGAAGLHGRSGLRGGGHESAHRYRLSIPLPRNAVQCVRACVLAAAQSARVAVEHRSKGLEG